MQTSDNDRSTADKTGTPAEAYSLADKLLEVHAWLRSQLRHVRSEAEAYFAASSGPGAPPKPGLGLQLRRHCLEFCQALEFHHTGEESIFPVIEDHRPDLSEALDRLRSEHRTVARLQGEIVALLADIEAVDPAVFTAELDRMAEELTAHLAYEEESLIPALAEVPFPPPEG